MRSVATMLVAASLGVLPCQSERACSARPTRTMPGPAASKFTPLPPPASKGGRSLEEVLASRRSQREFGARSLALSELGQLAWAAQGITDRSGPFRAAPSAGALYPLELYFATPNGVSHYLPAAHALEHRGRGDVRSQLAAAALGQHAVGQAPCVVVITAVTARTARKYGDRAVRYVALEAGHAAQNLLLQATSLKLVGVPIGAFDDAALRRVLALGPEEEPLYLVAIGPPVAG